MSIVVTLPYDPVWSPLEWAKKYCPSYITNQSRRTDSGDSIIPTYKIEYYFGNEKDALMFRLRWAK